MHCRFWCSPTTVVVEQACLYLRLARKVLGDEAWRDCVRGCCRTGVSGAVSAAAQVNWSNMELVLFGIDVTRAQDWQLQAGDALKECSAVRDLETSVASSAKGSKGMERLKEKLRAARWRFSLEVLLNMFNRMRGNVHERTRAMAV